MDHSWLEKDIHNTFINDYIKCPNNLWQWASMDTVILTQYPDPESTSHLK